MADGQAALTAPPEEVNVTTPPNSPVEQVASPQSTTPIAPEQVNATVPQGSISADVLAGIQAAQLPAQTMTSVPVLPATPSTDEHVTRHMGWLHSILDRVGTILGGDQTVHITKDTDGNVTVTHDPSTTGEKWGRIASAALGGAARGLANSQGPGGLARAAAAGTEYGLQLPQQRQQQVQEEATAEQKLANMRASNAMIHQNMVRQMLDNKLIGLKLTGAESDLLTDYRDGLLSDPNATDYGVINSADDLHKIGLANANFLKQHANLQLKAAALPDGKGGWSLHAIATDPGDDNRLVEPGDKVYGMEVDPSTGRPVLTSQTAAKGQKKGPLRVANQATISQFMTNLNNWTKANKQPTPPAGTEFDRFYTNWRRDNNLPDTAANELKARHQFAIAGSVRTGGEGGEGGGGAGSGGFNPHLSLQTNAQMMVDGLAAPSQLSKRAKDYNQMLPMAQAYSLQKYGEPFDAEISEARFKARQDVLKEFAGGKQADQIQAGQAFLNHAQAALDGFADLRNSDVRLFNTPLNKLRQMSGNPRVAAILPDISAVRREYENFLSNNMALKGDEIREGREMMNEDMSPAQFEAAMKSFAQTAVGRMGSLNERALRFRVPIGGELLTPRNMKTLANMGLADYASELIRRQPQSPHMFGGETQAQPTAPSGAGSLEDRLNQALTPGR